MEEWASDFCLTQNMHFFIYKMARTSYIQWDDDDVHFVLDQCLVGFLLC